MILSQEHRLYEEPLSMKRLGEAIFIKLPLYETNLPLEPIYINDSLFTTLFKQQASWNKKSEFIQKLFSITLDINQSNGRQCGWGFADRQGEDPYQLSLMGNLGSGRAFYTGTCFNIKGERTPLATSTKPLISNGILSLEDGIWSALIGNSLYEEFSVKPSPVLAILKINRTRCIIVRIDEDGALDRMTHLFYLPSALTEKQLKQTAYNLGQLEAEKFTHRILHGSWSAGNTSFSGHLIDYDSMCAVKGRQPQFSITPKFPDNYFGFEYHGQIKNLKSLCDNPLINPKGVKLVDLEKLLFKSFNQHLTEGLGYLMGFADYSDLSQQFAPLLKKLAESFYELCHYSYYISIKSMYTNYPSILFYHLFDFSALFRVYPLLKLTNQFSVQQGVQIIKNSPQQQAMLLAELNSLGESELPPEAKSEFSKYLINFREEYPKALDIKLGTFVENYERLFNQMLKASKYDEHQVAARAYVINEDRFYLMTVFSLAVLMIDMQHSCSAEVINRFIEDFILANQRAVLATSEKGYRANFRLIEEGYSHIFIDGKGEYQVAFKIYRDKISWIFNENDTWHIAVKDQLIPATCFFTEDIIDIHSSNLPAEQLAVNYSREDVFVIHHYVLYRNFERVRLRDLFYPEMDSGFYL